MQSVSIWSGYFSCHLPSRTILAMISIVLDIFISEFRADRMGQKSKICQDGIRRRCSDNDRKMFVEKKFSIALSRSLSCHSKKSRCFSSKIVTLRDEQSSINVWMMRFSLRNREGLRVGIIILFASLFPKPSFFVLFRSISSS